MKTTVFLGIMALGLITASKSTLAQSGYVSTSNLVCSLTSGYKTVSWSGSFQDVSGLTIVGAYAPVYGDFSPVVYYTPGAEMGAPPETGEDSPGGITGSPSVEVPNLDPNDSRPVEERNSLVGVYVWFQYGSWSQNGTTGVWSWQGNDLCSWEWLPNDEPNCFAPGTHLLTEDGSKPIEQFKVGEYILASRRDNSEATPVAQRIKRVITGREKLLKIVVNGKTIHTTRKHPIYTKDKGWITAGSLVVGDLLRASEDRWVEVQSVADGAESTVYNIVVDGKSAYFVGRRDWGFAVWASDGCSKADPPSEILPQSSERVVQRIKVNGSSFAKK